MIPVLILAAGQSRRMRGADKLMQDVDGKTLLRRQIDKAIPIGPVFVALPDRHHPRLEVLKGTTATPLVVPESSEGMGATLRCAVKLLPKGPFVMLLGDLIDIETKDLSCVINASLAHPDYLIWRGATTDGKPGHPIVFAESLREAFNRLQGDEGAASIVNPLKSQTYLHRFHDNRARRDLDTPEDWVKWRALKK